MSLRVQDLLQPHVLVFLEHFCERLTAYKDTFEALSNEPNLMDLVVRNKQLLSRQTVLLKLKYS